MQVDFDPETTSRNDFYCAESAARAGVGVKVYAHRVREKPRDGAGRFSRNGPPWSADSP